MEYAKQAEAGPRFAPRLIIHGGAGNIPGPDQMSPETYKAYRDALLSIVSRLAKTRLFMESAEQSVLPEKTESKADQRPSALMIATHAVVQLEDNPLFNSGHGSVFTRDGINELEASVMVSRGHRKRGVGVTGLRHVRNPILLARKMLEHGDEDLMPQILNVRASAALDIPSAQGHTLLHGPAAEQLARDYELEMVDPSYFFTKKRWDEHVRALDREKAGKGVGTWSAEEYLPQGTCGAVAMDHTGCICVATSTGGLTNKLTGRIGDTPVPGAGSWAEEWEEAGDPTGAGLIERWSSVLQTPGPCTILPDYMQSFLADWMSTLYPQPTSSAQEWLLSRGLHTTRAMGASGTGNGDSFMRTNALRTMAAMARWKPESSFKSVSHVAGPGGELQRSAGERWGRTGEGEGGIIGIESAIVRDSSGRLVDTRSQVVMDYNCGGMYRAWIDDDGKAIMSVWSNSGPDELDNKLDAM
ncbi:asparaginase domain-containing protein [Sarocladium implicatum]|nr:asparaginase domain-containing protein [Sarocladium implicatum]